MCFRHTVRGFSVHWRWGATDCCQARGASLPIYTWRLFCPRTPLHARIAPLSLFDSMLSEIRGLASRSLTHGLRVRSTRSAVTQTYPFSGLHVRFRAHTLHLVDFPLPKQQFPNTEELFRWAMRLPAVNTLIFSLGKSKRHNLMPGGAIFGCG